MATLLFGVANSDHQCESLYGPWPADVRDGWEEHPRGMATDFWERYQTDIDNAAWLGCKLFRFSISWARVQPVSGFSASKPALDHYREVVAAIKKKGMEPLVTLLHLVWPMWVQGVGTGSWKGLLSKEFPAVFAYYARKVATALKGVTYWCTINEPNTLLMGYLFPARWLMGPPPGLPGGVDFVDSLERLIPNLFLAHAKAYAAIKGINPRAMIGANPATLGLPPEHVVRMDRDMLAIGERRSLARHARKLSRSGHAPKRYFRSLAPVWGYRATVTSALNGNWWHLGMAGKLRPYLCPRGCEGTQDFIGFDYYWGVDRWWRVFRILRLVSALSRGQFRHAPVWPEGLSHQISYLSRLFEADSKPIMILENGCVDQADGLSRAAYLRKHVNEVLEARKRGAAVRAYICWSISTNRELGAPANDESDFGLFHVDLDRDPALRRQKTDSAIAYRRLIRNARIRTRRGSQR